MSSGPHEPLFLVYTTGDTDVGKPIDDFMTQTVR